MAEEKTFSSIPLKYQTQQEDHEDIFLMSDEEIIYNVKRLNAYQCLKFTNAKDPQTKMKLGACILHHLYPESRSCIPKEFLEKETILDELMEMEKCLMKNKNTSEASNILLKAVNESKFSYLENYKKTIIERSIEGNVPMERFIKEPIECEKEISNFRRCLSYASQKLQVDGGELARAIDFRESDYCYMEFTKMNYCILSNVCANEVLHCVKRTKENSMMSTNEALDLCINMVNGDSETMDCWSRINEMINDTLG